MEYEEGRQTSPCDKPLRVLWRKSVGCPRCLMDMLEVPDEIRSIVSDYRMNLSELRTSGVLKLSDSDINTMFGVSRFIYERNYDPIFDSWKDKKRLQTQ